MFEREIQIQPKFLMKKVIMMRNYIKDCYLCKITKLTILYPILVILMHETDSF